MYTIDELRQDRELWSGCKIIPAKCTWCDSSFEVKYGTLYNVIRRDADGLFCSRKCSGAFRAESTQNKLKEEGGKTCKRCGEFKNLDNFSILPNPPYLRSECKRCYNFKPARKYSSYKEKAKLRNQTFELNLDQFLIFWNNNCFYCGDKGNVNRLNLIDNSRGYIFKNIVSCCRECQKFKADLTHQQFINLCHKISDNVKEEI